MMEFTSKDYTSEDFREEEDLFTQFYYEEVSTAPGLTWCTEYFYRKLENGRYQLVEIDSFDNELYLHEEYATAEAFADAMKIDTSERELDPYIDAEILSLFPEDLKQYEEEVASHFSKILAELIHTALEEGDRELVQALLPDFDTLRDDINPLPYIPGISKQELERRKEIFRKYYISQGYVEESPDYFVVRYSRSRRIARIGEYDLLTATISSQGEGHTRTLFENMDIKDLPKVEENTDGSKK